MKTYVFGAGASKHVGYPLAKSMGHKLFKWMDEHDGADSCSFRQTAQFLRNNFEETDNIEELLTAIEKKIACGQESRPYSTEAVLLCQCHTPALIDAIRSWFVEIRLNEARDYARFAQGIIAPGDCVITFNYDVSLEAQLRIHGKWRLGDGYGFRMEGFEDHSPVRFLKLHGSVNWRFPAGSDDRPLIDPSEIAFLGYPGQSDPLFGRPIYDSGGGTMILPARCKQFYSQTNRGPLHKKFWDSLWLQADQILERSAQVVIFGYSLPEFDERACESLLKREYSASIEVCCGGATDDVVRRLKGFQHDARAAAEKHFDGWLNERLSTG
jgi:hypothetical protein